jgi:hypothetical protein
MVTSGAPCNLSRCRPTLLGGEAWTHRTGRNGKGSAFCKWASPCFCCHPANLLAGIWGAGNTMLPMAAGQARGSALQESMIAVGLRTGGASLIALCMVLLWGLRTPAAGQTDR